MSDDDDSAFASTINPPALCDAMLERVDLVDALLQCAVSWRRDTNARTQLALELAIDGWLRRPPRPRCICRTGIYDDQTMLCEKCGRPAVTP